MPVQANCRAASNIMRFASELESRPLNIKPLALEIIARVAVMVMTEPYSKKGTRRSDRRKTGKAPCAKISREGCVERNAATPI